MGYPEAGDIEGPLSLYEPDAHVMDDPFFGRPPRAACAGTVVRPPSTPSRAS
ncbi:hypothetical protein [Streptomyces sp. 1222.5]|uniref:hypothetical protein n=1 Tax=Streptomyces sp. 1222.5 TaxID=1881026 RepID=UPI003EBDBB25